MAKFQAKLEQHEWIITELFDIEADSAEEAQAKAEQFVKDEKDIAVEHRVSVEEVAEDPTTEDTVEESTDKVESEEQ